MQVDRVAGICQATLLFLLGAVSTATLSVVAHTRVHALSYVLLVLSLVIGYFAIVKLFNSIADRFPRPLGVLVHWIHAMTFEAFALLAVPMLRIFRNRKPIGAGRPILLVHGYCNSGSVWTYLKWRLEKEKLGRIYTIDLGHPFRSIRKYAEQVQRKAAEIRKETDRSDLVLVGHSMGGLVSTLYAADFAPPETVTDVITIGSPLGGTHVAKLGIGPNAREMERDSKLIAELSSKLSKESFTRYYHIGTNTDQLVIPSQSAFLNQNTSREFLFEDIGHASMLFSPRVGTLLACWLRDSL